MIRKYGWKTILGTVLIASGEVAAHFPETSAYSTALTAVGTVLGGVGLRMAVAQGRG